MNSWNDNVLIKLKRKYSKDETVAALTKKLSETEILLGMRNDEISELKCENEELKTNKKIKEKINKTQQDNINRIENLKKKNIELEMKHNNLRIMLSDSMAKNNKLKDEINNLKVSYNPV